MDVSSEMIHSLLPVFLVDGARRQRATVGLIEGMAEATALIVKVFSGVLCDYWGRRKPLAVLGYGLGALSKPLFALAAGTGLVLTARLIDRVGKGIRGAPRDALVADIAPPEVRGAAFGLRQSLDTVGAFLGPLLAMGLMLALGERLPRRVLGGGRCPPSSPWRCWSSACRSRSATATAKPVNPIRREQLRRLPTAYWWVVGHRRGVHAGALLRGVPGPARPQGGLPIAFAPLVLVAMNVVYALAAYPFGRLSDRIAPHRLLVLGLVVLIGADVVLA